MSSECNPNRHAINRLTQQPCNSIHSTITYQYNLQRQANKPNKMRHEFRQNFPTVSQRLDIRKIFAQKGII